jgi:hypothetical protein
MGRENRAKLSVTVDPNLYQVVTRYAERAKVSKSRVIEEAIRLWEKNRLALLAKEGYQKMGHENVGDAEAYLPALSDSSPLRYRRRGTQCIIRSLIPPLLQRPPV